MKLYELPRGSWFTIDNNEMREVFKLDHLDGMYSVCWVRGLDGVPVIVHIAVYTEVTEVEQEEGFL